AKSLKEMDKSFRLARALRLVHDLAPRIHNANAREFQRDVDSDIVFHGCPPSQMPGADSTSCARISRDPIDLACTCWNHPIRSSWASPHASWLRRFLKSFLDRLGSQGAATNVPALRVGADRSWRSQDGGNAAGPSR